MEKLWYVVNTYSGHEQKVKEKLESKIESMEMQDHIFRIIVPETTEVEIKDGVAVWDYPETHEHGYLISSEDDTKVLIFQSSDVTLPDVFDSIEFK